jgi:hypothetical protein
MRLNHDAHNCTMSAEQRPVEQRHAEHRDAESGEGDSTRFNRRHTDKVVKDSSTGIEAAYNPDVIFPAAETEEEDIDSEFYPEIYIP